MLFNNDNLIKEMKMLTSCTATRESRPALCGVHMVYDGKSDCVLFESCDSYKLYRCRLHFDLSAGETFPAAFDLLFKPFKTAFNKKAPVINFDPVAVSFSDFSTSITPELIQDYDFPNLETIAKKQPDTEYKKISLSVDYLKEIISSMETKTKDGKNVLTLEIPSNPLRPVFITDLKNNSIDPDSYAMLSPVRSYN